MANLKFQGERVSKEIKTAFEERSGSFGNMFDIYTHRPIQITSFDIHTDVSGFVEVWTCAGSFESYKQHPLDTNHWRLLSNTTIEGAGRMQPTSIPPSEFESLEIDKGVTQGFYVTMTTHDLRYTVMSHENGTPYPSSSDLDILIGCGVRTYPYIGDIVDKRLWNGIVHYEVAYQPSNVLFSTFANNGKTANVLLFEIYVYKNITITSFDLHLDGKDDRIGIATMNGSYNPDQNWASLSQSNVKSSGRMGMTSIPFQDFTTLKLKENTIQTFMITSSKGNLIYSDPTNQELPTQILNDEIKLNLGYALNEEYKPVGNAIIFNGIIRYHEDECQNVHEILSASEKKQSSNGILFEIKPITEILVESFKVSVDSEATVIIKTRKGSIVDLNDDSWMNVTQESISTTSLINLYPSAVSIEADTIQSFYISADNLQLTSDPIEHDGVAILGKIVKDDGSVEESNLYLYGGLYYSTKTSCKITEEPSAMPSNSPSDIPSIGHSLSPFIASSNKPTSEIHTSVPSVFPSSIPTTSPSLLLENIPTLFPSITLTEITDKPTTSSIDVAVEYMFNIMYDPTSKHTNQIRSDIDNSIAYSLNKVINELSYNNTMFNAANVTLQSVTTIFANHTTNMRYNNDIGINSCIPKLPAICSVIHSTIVTSHDLPEITKGMMQFLLYHLASTTLHNLPFAYKEYVGIQPLFTQPVISLSGDGDVTMDDDSTSYYQDTVQEFLNELFISTSVKVTDVSTSSNFLQMLFEGRRLNPLSRASSSLSSSSSLDISTGITAEYKPPPQVDFDALVQDSIDSHSDQLISKLAKNPTFSSVKKITSVHPVKNEAKQVTPEAPPLTDNTTMLIIIISSVVGAILFLACVIFAVTRAMNKKDEKEVQKRLSMRDSFSNLINATTQSSSAQSYFRTSFSNLVNSNKGRYYNNIYSNGYDQDFVNNRAHQSMRLPWMNRQEDRGRGSSYAY